MPRLFLGSAASTTAPCNSALGSFACARIRFRALAMDRQSAAMTEPSVTTDLDQSFNIHLDIATQITFHFEILGNVITHRAHIGFCEVVHPNIRVYFCCSQDLSCPGWSDSKYVSPTSIRLSRGKSTPSILAMPLIPVVVYVLDSHK
jgi:hypothetical protein